jgi:hypothetical protein
MVLIHPRLWIFQFRRCTGVAHVQRLLCHVRSRCPAFVRTAFYTSTIRPASITNTGSLSAQHADSNLEALHPFYSLDLSLAHIIIIYLVQHVPPPPSQIPPLADQPRSSLYRHRRRRPARPGLDHGGLHPQLLRNSNPCAPVR